MLIACLGHSSSLILCHTASTTCLLLQLEGAFDLKRVLDDLPIYSVGSLTMEGLRAVLKYLGANQGGKCTVCISDIREVSGRGRGVGNIVGMR